MIEALRSLLSPEDFTLRRLLAGCLSSCGRFCEYANLRYLVYKVS